MYQLVWFNDRPYRLEMYSNLDEEFKPFRKFGPHPLEDGMRPESSYKLKPHTLSLEILPLVCLVNIQMFPSD